MHVMAGSTRYPFLKMFGLYPINILLVMALGKLICVKMLHIPGAIRGGFIVDFEGLAGLVFLVMLAATGCGRSRRSVPLLPW